MKWHHQRGVPYTRSGGSRTNFEGLHNALSSPEQSKHNPLVPDDAIYNPAVPGEGVDVSEQHLTGRSVIIPERGKVIVVKGM